MQFFPIMIVGFVISLGLTPLSRQIAMRLDVVDTNPRARQLYERKGFVAVSSNTYPLTQRFFGFSGSTTMMKTV